MILRNDAIRPCCPDLTFIFVRRSTRDETSRGRFPLHLLTNHPKPSEPHDPGLSDKQYHPATRSRERVRRDSSLQSAAFWRGPIPESKSSVPRRIQSKPARHKNQLTPIFLCAGVFWKVMNVNHSSPFSFFGIWRVQRVVVVVLLLLRKSTTHFKIAA